MLFITIPMDFITAYVTRNSLKMNKLVLVIGLFSWSFSLYISATLESKVSAFCLFCPSATFALQRGGFVPLEWQAAKGLLN